MRHLPSFALLSALSLSACVTVNASGAQLADLFNDYEAAGNGISSAALTAGADLTADLPTSGTVDYRGVMTLSFNSMEARGETLIQVAFADDAVDGQAGNFVLELSPGQYAQIFGTLNMDSDGIDRNLENSTVSVMAWDVAGTLTRDGGSGPDVLYLFDLDGDGQFFDDALYLMGDLSGTVNTGGSTTAVSGDYQTAAP